MSKILKFTSVDSAREYIAANRSKIPAGCHAEVVRFTANRSDLVDRYIIAIYKDDTAEPQPMGMFIGYLYGYPDL